MFFRTWISRAALVLMAAGIAGALPSEASAQARFKVDGGAKGVKIVGAGCPTGTVAVASLNEPDSQALTVLFSALSVTGEAPKVTGNGRTEAVPVAKACRISVDLIPNPGFQIALFNVDVRGSVDVFGSRDTDVGLNNVVGIDRRYAFTTVDTDNKGRAREFLTLLTRVVDSSSAYTIGEETASLVGFAGCNARVRARIAVRVSATGELNYGDISAIDQNSSIQFGLRSRPCTGNEPTRDPAIQPIPAARRTLNRNLCVLEDGIAGPRLRGPRSKVCYNDAGRELSREPDPDL